MRQLIMLLAALIFGGCASGYVSQVGPWSAPVVRGKTGMPDRRDNVWTQVGVCRFGPTLPYPVMPEVTCI